MSTSTTGRKASQPVIWTKKDGTKIELRRRRCKYDGCRKVFQQTKPDHDFCKKECRYAYHKFGSAFGTLQKAGLDRIVKHATEKMLASLPRLAKKFLRDWTDDIERRIATVEKNSFTMEMAKGMADVNGAFIQDLHRRLSAIEPGAPPREASRIQHS